MQQNRPTPAPIFNYRKRPRQAVIADPQADDPPSGPAGAAPRYSDLIPPNMFGQAAGPHNPMPGFSRGSARSRPPTRGQTNASRRPTSRGGPTTRGGRGWQANNQQQQNRNMGDYQQSGNAQKFTSSSFSQQSSMERPQSYVATGFHGNTYSATTPQSSSTYQHYGAQQRGNSYQTHGPRSGNSYQSHGSTGGNLYQAQGSTGGNSYQTMGPLGDASNYQYSAPRGRGYNNRQQGSSTRGSYPTRDPSNAPQRGGHTASYPARGGAMPYNPIPAKAATATSTFSASRAILDDWDGETKPTVQPRKPTKVDAEIDKSLHLLTVDVAGVHRWNKQKDKIPVMFELYGCLDSAITRSEERCKEFLIRDDKKEAIKCVFYEIDRPLPKLTRGQWQRCVGTLDRRMDRFKCISLRPVSDGERRLVPKLIGNTETFMQGLTSKLRES